MYKHSGVKSNVLKKSFKRSSIYLACGNYSSDNNDKSDKKNLNITTSKKSYTLYRVYFLLLGVHSKTCISNVYEKLLCANCSFI